MDPKYIFAISALSVFFILVIIFFILLAHKRKTEAKLQAWLHEVYADKNLIKEDYDVTGEEEPVRPAKSETNKTEEKVSEREQQAALKESEENSPKIEEFYGKIEVEGIEEITGNYNPQ